jgi:hypothetical protein
MRALALALLLTATQALAGSQAVVSKRQAPVVPTADILNETFTDAVGGYATAGWTETGPGTIDEDETGGCPAGTGWATQCLETSGVQQNAFTEWNLGSGRTATSYFVIHFDAATLGTWSDTQEQIIFTVDSQTAIPPSVFTASAIASLAYYVDATSDTYSPDCGAYPCFRLTTRIGGTESATVPEVSLATIHNLRFRITSGAATGEVIFDGTTIGSGMDSDTGGHGAWQYIRVGHVESSPQTSTIYWDTINVSSTGYVD